MGCSQGLNVKNSNMFAVTKFEMLEPESIKSKYKMIERIGQSMHSVVYKVVNRRTNAIRALKTRSYKTQPGTVPREIDVLSSLDHPCILKMFDFCIEQSSYSIVMELPAGEGLCDYMLKTNSISQYFASRIIKQLLSAVCYMHSEGFVHSSIKPENIIVDTSKTNDIGVKLLHFAHALRTKEKSKKKNYSLYYDPPEVISEFNFSEMSDVWNCGVILYFLLSGQVPFDGATEEEVIRKIKCIDVNLELEELEEVSEDCKDLIRQMLEKDLSKRITCQQAFNHKWITQYNRMPNTTRNLEKILRNVSQIKAKMNIQEVALQFITHEITSSAQAQKLKTLFVQFDKNGDGKISRDELIDVFKEEGHSDKEIDRIIKKIDSNNDGVIEYEEFIRAFSNQETLLSEENLRAAFTHFDIDGSEKIDIEELKLVFSGTEVNIKKEMHLIDKNKDGKIDFEEFKKMMMKLVRKN